VIDARQLHAGGQQIAEIRSNVRTTEILKAFCRIAAEAQADLTAGGGRYGRRVRATGRAGFPSIGAVEHERNEEAGKEPCDFCDGRLGRRAVRSGANAEAGRPDRERSGHGSATWCGMRYYDADVVAAAWRRSSSAARGPAGASEVAVAKFEVVA